MSAEEDNGIFEEVLPEAEASAVDRVQVYFGNDDRVVGFGSPAAEDTELPAGATRTEVFELPIAGVDPDTPLWDYQKPADDAWSLISQDTCLERDHGDLETYRREMIRQLTARVNSRNEKAAGIGLGRDALHNEKIAEVAEYDADGTVGPYIQLEMDIKFKTAQDVVDSIKAKRAAEQAYKLGTEAVFMTVKEALKAASTHTEICDAMQNIVWPEDS